MNLKSTGGEGGVTLTREQCIARLEQAMRDEPLHEADPDYPYAVAILAHLRSCAQDAPGVSEEDLALIIEALRDKELHHADVHRTHGTEEFMTGHGPLAKRCAELAQRLRGAGSGK